MEEKMFKLWLLFMLCVAQVSSVSALSTVDSVDLDRYVGKWYEIASYPTWFQKDCRKSTAFYEKVSGHIKVTNECVSVKSGDLKTTEGRAWVVDQETNAKLKVQFFLSFIQLPIFAGDYHIIMLDNDYKYAVVSEPKMEYLWILSRNPEMDRDQYLDITNELANRGFDLSKLKRTNL